MDRIVDYDHDATIYRGIETYDKLLDAKLKLKKKNASSNGDQVAVFECDDPPQSEMFDEKTFDDVYLEYEKIYVPGKQRVLIEEDISGGMAPHPIPCYCDDLTDPAPPDYPFQYIHGNILSKQVKTLVKPKSESKVICCTCIGRCLPERCECIQFVKTYNGEQNANDYGLMQIQLGNRLPHEPSVSSLWNNLAFGCGSKCQCSEATCDNRIHRDLSTRLEIFKRKLKSEQLGYGLRTLVPIERGQILMEFAGEVMTYDEIYAFDKPHERSQKGKKEEDKVPEPNLSYSLLLYEGKEKKELERKKQKGLQKIQKEHGSDMPDKTLFINPLSFGNESRFIGHACIPNLEIARYAENSLNPLSHRIFLVARCTVLAGAELFFDYGPHYKLAECRCRTVFCRAGPYNKKYWPDAGMKTPPPGLVTQCDEKRFKENQILDCWIRQKKRKQREEANHWLAKDNLKNDFTRTLCEAFMRVQISRDRAANEILAEGKLATWTGDRRDNDNSSDDETEAEDQAAAPITPRQVHLAPQATTSPRRRTPLANIEDLLIDDSSDDEMQDEVQAEVPITPHAPSYPPRRTRSGRTPLADMEHLLLPESVHRAKKSPSTEPSSFMQRFPGLQKLLDEQNRPPAEAAPADIEADIDDAPSSDEEAFELDQEDDEVENAEQAPLPPQQQQQEIRDIAVVEPDVIDLSDDEEFFDAIEASLLEQHAAAQVQLGQAIAQARHNINDHVEDPVVDFAEGIDLPEPMMVELANVADDNVYVWDDEAMEVIPRRAEPVVVDIDDDDCVVISDDEDDIVFVAVVQGNVAPPPLVLFDGQHRDVPAAPAAVNTIAETPQRFNYEALPRQVETPPIPAAPLRQQPVRAEEPVHEMLQADVPAAGTEAPEDPVVIIKPRGPAVATPVVTLDDDDDDTRVQTKRPRLSSNADIDALMILDVPSGSRPTEAVRNRNKSTQ